MITLSEIKRNTQASQTCSLLKSLRCQVEGLPASTGSDDTHYVRLFIAYTGKTVIYRLLDNFPEGT